MVLWLSFPAETLISRLFLPTITFSFVRRMETARLIGSLAQAREALL